MPCAIVSRDGRMETSEEAEMKSINKQYVAGE